MLGPVDYSLLLADLLVESSVWYASSDRKLSPSISRLSFTSALRLPLEIGRFTASLSAAGVHVKRLPLLLLLF